MRAVDVGAVALEGGDDGLCRGGGPWLRCSLSCWVVGFFIKVGASRVCSSHSSHGVLSLAWVRGHPVFRVVCLGLALVVPVFMWGVVPFVSVFR
jgi:hypothetical protein